MLPTLHICFGTVALIPPGPSILTTKRVGPTAPPIPLSHLSSGPADAPLQVVGCAISPTMPTVLRPGLSPGQVSQ